MQEDVIGAKVRRTLCLALGSVVLAAVGAALLILGITGSGTGFTIGGGAILFLCFYLIPISWIWYSEQRKRMRVVRLIEGRQKTPVALIASSLAVSEEVARSTVADCLSAGLVPGYALDGDTVVLARYMDPEQEEKTMRCSYCNATFTYKGDIAECPYCGNVVHDERSRVTRLIILSFE